MILITTRAAEVAEWIEANCAEPSRYTMAEPWPADIAEVDILIKSDQQRVQEIDLKLSEIDATMFALYFAGWFIRHPHRECWYDDNEINRKIIALRLFAH